MVVAVLLVVLLVVMLTVLVIHVVILVVVLRVSVLMMTVESVMLQMRSQNPQNVQVSVCPVLVVLVVASTVMVV